MQERGAYRREWMAAVDGAAFRPVAGFAGGIAIATLSTEGFARAVSAKRLDPSRHGFGRSRSASSNPSCIEISP